MAAKTNVKVDVKTNMLGVFDGDKIIAAYPVTVGSKQTATPIGEWKGGVAKLTADLSLRRADVKAWRAEQELPHPAARSK